MIVWLWDAGENARGVTDDEMAARRDVEARLPDGETARVERALVRLPFQYLISGYVRTGIGWEARRAAGQLTWNELHPVPRQRDNQPPVAAAQPR